MFSDRIEYIANVRFFLSFRAQSKYIHIRNSDRVFSSEFIGYLFICLFEKKVVVVVVYHPICIYAYALKEATCDTTTTVVMWYYIRVVF